VQLVSPSLLMTPAQVWLTFHFFVQTIKVLALMINLFLTDLYHQESWFTRSISSRLWRRWRSRGAFGCCSGLINQYFASEFIFHLFCMCLSCAVLPGCISWPKRRSVPILYCIVTQTPIDFWGTRAWRVRFWTDLLHNFSKFHLNLFLFCFVLRLFLAHRIMRELREFIRLAAGVWCSIIIMSFEILFQQCFFSVFFLWNIRYLSVTLLFSMGCQYLFMRVCEHKIQQASIYKFFFRHNSSK
jgi:hypothetical protein